MLVALGVVYHETLVNDAFQDDLQTTSNEDLFEYPSIPSLAINQFGVITFIPF